MSKWPSAELKLTATSVLLLFHTQCTYNNGQHLFVVKQKQDVEEIISKIISAARAKQTVEPKHHDNAYTFNNSYRGLAVIISNETFDTLSQRTYCDDELAMMAITFGNQLINFTTVVFKDLTEEKMEWLLDTASEQEQFHQNSDCFACIIASHGGEQLRPLKNNASSMLFRDHCLSGTDNQTITTKSVIQRFSTLECLVNKPKIFFIQACRSTSDGKLSLDKGFDIEVNESFKEEDAEDMTEPSVFGKLFGWNKSRKPDAIRVINPPCEEDCLVVYSASSEKKSYGRDKLGGWMLHSLYTTIWECLHHYCCVDFLSVLIDMSRYLSENFVTNLGAGKDDPKCKSTVVIEHCLQKEIYFE